MRVRWPVECSISIPGKSVLVTGAFLDKTSDEE